MKRRWLKLCEQKTDVRERNKYMQTGKISQFRPAVERQLLRCPYEFLTRRSHNVGREQHRSCECRNDEQYEHVQVMTHRWTALVLGKSHRVSFINGGRIAVLVTHSRVRRTDVHP